MDKNPFDNYTNDYENWFKENYSLFQSELLALKQVIPVEKKGLEIGVGSGIFAEKLDIKFGIDISENMLNYARKRQINVVQGFAESLPYPDSSFDYAVFITSICFINNPSKALDEAYRVIKNGGDLIIAFIDKDSTLGQKLTIKKEDSKFFKTANLYSAKDMISLIETTKFKITKVLQTLIDLNNKRPENPIEGFGKGSFVVIKGQKKNIL
ncbi:MAG: class I SAM-dependent methyltransferase [Bacteroidales bacterium]|nr:class I SAM-dependent methyltransferase [Bacteroidales bacterium]